jgi:hypothetical protein
MVDKMKDLSRSKRELEEKVVSLRDELRRREMEYQSQERKYEEKRM